MKRKREILKVHYLILLMYVTLFQGRRKGKGKRKQKKVKEIKIHVINILGINFL
jgi:hypothetical protein